MNSLPRHADGRRLLDRVVVRRLPGVRHRGVLLAGPLQLPCALGRTGIVRRKREGDGATPSGRFRLDQAFRRPEALPRLRVLLPQRDLCRRDGWCDDPGDRRYNRFVRLPVDAGHERLWRDDALYDIVVALDHNSRPRVAGRGSAIFFHMAAPGLVATAGCVALAPGDMRRLLPRLRRRSTMVIT